MTGATLVLAESAMDNLGRVLLKQFEGYSGGSALVDVRGGLTYQALANAAFAVECGLRDAGLGPNEPVLVPVANEPRDVAALIGVWIAGGVAVPIARQAPRAALAGIRAQIGARFSVINDANEVVAVLNSETPPPRPLLEGAAIIVLTSGSTGRPKGVVLGHGAFVGKLRAIDNVLRFTSATRTLLVLQITFVFGLWVALLTLLKGGTVQTHGRFNSAEFLRALKSERISDAALVPTMMRKCLALDKSISADLSGTDTHCEY